ncbi:MAG: hypothetical protein SGILL_009002, partial [Bacillariaceae sp.]
GFSYVYLVKDLGEGGLSSSLHSNAGKQGNEEGAAGPDGQPGPQGPMVLKVTSIHSRAQRDIAEKEAKLLSRLSHPSIVRMYDTCYRTPAQQQSGKRGKDSTSNQKERPQHLILMEYCEGGHALDVCSKFTEAGQKFDLSTLIIAFGQICNAVSYLHAQRPPIVHRDLKPVNFLVKNGAYKLCDFGSAVFGHVDLRTAKARSDAEEVIEKTTTQMFRAPEMVDLYSAKRLTQAYVAERRGYTIPDDNPYGDGLVELLDRMLTVDPKARADMTEVILCLSAVYSGRPLPPRKKPSRSSSKVEGKEDSKGKEAETKKDAVGTFRVDSQGYQENLYDPTKVAEGKKLAQNSVAARRKRAAGSAAPTPAAAPAKTPAPAPAPAPASKPSAEDPLAFSALQGTEESGVSDVAFSSDFGKMEGEYERCVGTPDNGYIVCFEDSKSGEFFGSFDDVKATQSSGGDGFDAAALSSAWGEPVASTEPSTTEGQELENGFDGEADGGDNTKKDSDQKRSSRRRQPGARQSRSNRGGVEAGMDAMKISDAENGGGAEGEGRRDRRGEDSRKRSSSRSKRKARGQRDARPEKS